MMSSLDELFEKAADLPEGDRATLAGLLIESLESEIDPGVDEAWAQEIERRLVELDSGDVKGVPWKRVRTNLVRRLGRS